MVSEEDVTSPDSDGQDEEESADPEPGHDARGGRALRNKMARERRKRRKQARQRWFTALEGATSGPAAACDFSTLGLQSSRLGQAQETYLKQKLDRLASFSVLQHGYTRNSAVIISLLQDILDIVPGRPTAYRANAQGLVQVLPAPNPHWRGSFLPKVLGSFASGNEGGTIVRVNGMAPSARPVPLSMLAQMDSSVHVEQYLRRLNECRELLPKVCQPGKVAAAAKQAIRQKYYDACFYGALMLVSQPLRMGQAFMGGMLAGKPAHNTITFKEAVFVWDALGIDSATHARMWRIYEEAAAGREVIVADLMAMRARVLSILAMHDAGSSVTYVDLLDATSQLLGLSQRLLAQHVSKQSEILYMLEPFQAGAIAAMQLPRTSLHNMMASDRLPFNGPLELMSRLGDPATVAAADWRDQQP